MTLSIVIANWNTKEMIRQCVDSIFGTVSPELKYEVIVIDNASTDGSAGYLRTLGDRITLISNDENLGYAKACNQGMKIASGKYVLLLGSDTIIQKGAVEKCVRFLDDNSPYGAVGCKLLNPDGSTQNSLKQFPGLKNAFYTYLSLDGLNKDYDMASFDYSSSIDADQIAATFLMVKTDILKQLNYFDESYRILYNDVDICRRIWKAGYKIFFIHDCSIIHYGSHSTKSADFGLRRIMYSDIYRYYKNNFGFKAKFLYPILVLRLLIVSTIKA